jgi:type IV fimbrial biogenesis protein FimT
MPNRKRLHHVRGFTLIEQTMCVAVLSVLVCLGIPSLRSLLGGTHLQTAQADLFTALQYARTTAVTRQQAVVVCPSRDGQQCSDDTEWNAGWLIGKDNDRDGHIDETPLRTMPGDSALSIRSTSGRRLVRFLPDGSAAGSNLTLLLCAQGSHDARQVIVSNAGRVRSTSPNYATVCS